MENVSWWDDCKVNEKQQNNSIAHNCSRFLKEKNVYTLSPL